MLPSSADCRGLEPNIREVGDGQHVHDTPGVVGEVTARRGADRIAHAAARAVAADNVLGADHRLRAGRHVLQRHLDGMHAFGFDLEVDEIQSVIGHEPCRRFLHVILEVLQ